MMAINKEKLLLNAPTERYEQQLIGGKMAPSDPKNPRKVVYYDKDGKLLMPEDGKVYMASGGHIYESMKRHYRDKPTSVMLLKTPSGKANLNTIAEQIVSEDKLVDLSTKDLAKQIRFDPDGYSLDYGKRGLKKMAEQGLVTEETIKQLKQEMRTGQAAPKKQEPNADAPKAGELPKNQEKNNNQPEGMHI